MFTRLDLFTGLLIITGGGCALPDAGGAKTVTLTAKLNIKNIDGSPAACPPIFDTAWIRADGYQKDPDTGEILIDAGDPYWPEATPCTTGLISLVLPISGDETDLYCMDGTCTRFPRHDISNFYTVSALLSDVSHSILRAETPRQPITFDGDAMMSFDVYPGTTYKSVVWNLYSKDTGAPLSCDQAGVDHVRVTITLVGTMEGDNETVVTNGRAVTRTLPCVDGDQMSDRDPIGADGPAGLAMMGPLANGYYSVEVEGLVGASVVATDMSMPRDPTDPPGVNELPAKDDDELAEITLGTGNFSASLEIAGK